MRQIIPIIVAGKPFRQAVELLRSELLAVIDAPLDEMPEFHMSRVFQLISFTGRNRDFQNLLVGRGSLRRIDGQIHNSGDSIDTSLVDPQLGDGRIYIGRQIKFDYESQPDFIEFTAVGQFILLVGEIVPPELGWGNRYVGTSIRFENDAVHYLLYEEGVFENGEPQHFLKFSVDLNKEAERLSILERESRSTSIHLTAQASDESCCRFGVSWPLPDPWIPSNDVSVGIVYIGGDPYFELANPTSEIRKIHYTVTYFDSQWNRRERKKWGESILPPRNIFREELYHPNSSDWEITKDWETKPPTAGNG